MFTSSSFIIYLPVLTKNGRVGYWLERLPTLPKIAVQDPPGTIGWKLALCPPSSKWGPGGNTGEIKAARKGTGHPTSQCRWPMTKVPLQALTNVRIVFGTYLYFDLSKKQKAYP